MPYMNGEEVLRELKIIYPEVRVLLSSGFNEVEAVRRFTGKGLAGFLQKPYTSATLAGLADGLSQMICAQMMRRIAVFLLHTLNLVGHERDPNKDWSGNPQKSIASSESIHEF